MDNNMDKTDLKEILLAQKRETEQILKQEDIIEREILDSSKKYVDTNVIKVVTGVRRCGKSVFSNELLNQKKFAYANFDDERLFRLRTENLNDLLEVLHEIYGRFKHLFLDEVQNIQGWELFANRCRRQGYNILLTGSNSKLLSKELATHLTGRYIELGLYPFSFYEYLRYIGLTYTDEDLYMPDKIGEIKNRLLEYIESGGFPEPLKYPELEKRYLTDLYNAIITKDIITRYNVRYSKTLKDLATYLISNYSSEITYNKLKNIFNAKSVHTIENYVSYIEEAYLIFQVYPFSYKTKLQLMSPKKIYAIDTGLINALTAKHFDNRCRLIENIVALELFRKRALNQTEIYYYKSKQQQEVDFVIKNGLNIVQLIQVCYSPEHEKTREREIRALLRASEELKCENLLVITWDYTDEQKIDGKKIIFMPLWRWLLDKRETQSCR
ncbi:MAG: ATP-binding protein [archaeon]|nr:ATP-binding protein [archaeon]